MNDSSGHLDEGKRSDFWPMIPPAVIRDTAIGHATARVYAALAIYTDAQTGEAFPAQETLARDVGIAVRTIRHHIDKLVAAGHIEKVRRIHHGANVYKLPVRVTGNPVAGSDGVTGNGVAGVSGNGVAGYKQSNRQSRDSNRQFDDRVTGNPVAYKQTKNKTTKNKPSSCPRKFSDADLATAAWMLSLVRAIYPPTKEPDFEKWAECIRLMRERDDRTDLEIRTIFEWANQDDFWQDNVRSPDALRRHWEKIDIKRRKRNGSHNHGRSGPGQRHDPARPIVPTTK